MCMTCGKIGCCDTSPNRHATAHAGESGHPIIRSAEPGEEWSWCYIDEVAFRRSVDAPIALCPEIFCRRRSIRQLRGPPFERDDPHRELERASIERLRELRDCDEVVA